MEDTVAILIHMSRLNCLLAIFVRQIQSSTELSGLVHSDKCTERNN